jgi:two-component system chemotaxis sensor kinase CheA
MPSLLVRVGGATYALPLHAVTETLRVEPADVQRLHRREAIRLRGAVLPLLPLRDVFGLEPVRGAARRPRFVVSVKAGGDRRMGLVVDSLVGGQEVVIKPLGKLVGDVRGVSGAAILGDGSVALILDVPSLIGRAIDEHLVLREDRVDEAA